MPLYGMPNGTAQYFANDAEYEAALKNANQAQATAGQISEDERRQTLMDQYRGELEKDLAKGKSRGEELFGNQALGRVGEERSDQMKRYVGGLEQNLNGLTPEEQNALESQVIGGINQQSQTQLRQLRGLQGASGVRGGAALGGQLQVANEAARQSAQARQNLFLQNAGLKRQALGEYGKGVQEAEASELGRRQFNLGQSQRETFGKLATEFGYGQLGSAERSGINQLLIGEKQAKAAEEAAKNSGGKK